jgi:hypothetical protein
VFVDEGSNGSSNDLSNYRVKDILLTARRLLEEGNLNAAFELAQEALNYLQQVKTFVWKFVNRILNVRMLF